MGFFTSSKKSTKKSESGSEDDASSDEEKVHQPPELNRLPTYPHTVYKKCLFLHLSLIEIVGPSCVY